MLGINSRTTFSNSAPRAVAFAILQMYNELILKFYTSAFTEIFIYLKSQQELQVNSTSKSPHNTYEIVLQFLLDQTPLPLIYKLNID